jgi:hypothetical protein
VIVGTPPRAMDLVQFAGERVFLSHGHSDKPFVRLVTDELRGAGFAPWLDEIELLPGDSLIVAISNAVADSAYVIAFLSPTSVTSAWVEKELAIAMTIGIREKRVIVLPILLPGLKREDVPAFLLDQLYIDLRKPSDYDTALTQLYRRLLPDGVARDVEILKARHVNINADRAEHLVHAANDPANRQWITDYLAAHVAGSRMSRDHTERHFAYWALGEVGGATAASAVEAGLKDIDPFARLGAENAWQRIKRFNK